MAKQVGAMGPTGIRVGHRLRELRQAHGLTLNSLTTRLAELGRPIDLSALAKIEKGQRRVDVDDLVALGLALDVSPNWLLLPPTSGENQVDLTMARSMRASAVWSWALHDRPAGPPSPKGRSAQSDQQFPERSNFWFLQAEWPDLYREAATAESLVYSDSRISCFYSRSTLEIALRWLHQNLKAAQPGESASILSILSDTVVMDAMGSEVLAMTMEIRRKGTMAVHTTGTITTDDSLAAIVDLFHAMMWFTRNYSSSPEDRLDETPDFDHSILPLSAPISTTNFDHTLQSHAPLVQAPGHASTQASDHIEFKLFDIEAELPVASDPGRRIELESREIFEQLLEESGWTDSSSITRDYALSPKLSNEEFQFIDYILWDDDHSPLALVEIKSRDADPSLIFRQLQDYAKYIEVHHSRIPALFCVSGTEVFLWDELASIPRQVTGFYSKEEIRRRVVDRSGRTELNNTVIDETIELRGYQKEIVRRVCDAFESGRRRSALVSMAVGTGKLRTCLALIDVLRRGGWVNRILYLTDSQLMTEQAVSEFRTHLPDLLVTSDTRLHNNDAHVFVGMPHRLIPQIESAGDDRPSPYGHGFFDLIVINEMTTMRSRRYHPIADYFDALLVGFTSAPPDGIDNDIYQLFDLKNGEPTGIYSFRDAVADGYLASPEFRNVKIKAASGSIEDSVTHLASEEFIDAALKILMEQGILADDGYVGKTIIFAQSIGQAQLIAHRCRINYPELGNEFALPINSKTTNAPELIKRFLESNSKPRIAISSGMLDAGISTPNVVNLLFLKNVHSKGRFWIMLGGGARLASRSSSHGGRKDSFRVIDFGNNLLHLQ
ncbi:helix-turn-helix domain-containing protein [Nocardia colli]|uniref:Helix-turn-helix domain-containing protein n=1 Tax=Nocardia colli TaxID=2545717 RepID=A0A5N0E5F5_9NOCA|nr:DEAD/DEAH box helicase family protein [Nocardia colli]KAA8884206.1 helix-turn-helix domain-containing protein [Nocardia colli]